MTLFFPCNIKRKDKLREHMQRMHNPDREAKKADRIHRSKTLKLKVPTTDFESFMFKCRVCMMGFRRRGMLVSNNSQTALFVDVFIPVLFHSFFPLVTG